MKVGLYLTNQQHLSADMVRALEDQITMGHLARDYGWASIFSGKYYLTEGDNQHSSIETLRRNVDVYREALDLEKTWPNVFPALRTSLVRRIDRP